MKQVALNGFVISILPGSSTPRLGAPPPIRTVPKPNFTVLIVQSEPISHGFCCLCQRRDVLSYCLEYINDKGELIEWGDICQNCVDKTTRGID